MDRGAGAKTRCPARQRRATRIRGKGARVLRPLSALAQVWETITRNTNIEYRHGSCMLFCGTGHPHFKTGMPVEPDRLLYRCNTTATLHRASSGNLALQLDSRPRSVPTAHCLPQPTGGTASPTRLSAAPRDIGVNGRRGLELDSGHFLSLRQCPRSEFGSVVVVTWK